MPDPRLIAIKGTDNADRQGDVIFVHGLGGSALETWHTDKKALEKAQKSEGEAFQPGQLNFWPAWLGEDYPQLGIWSLDYDIEPLAWRGNTMPLTDRATNILQVFSNKRIGNRPILFITHSMGGLLVKQMLRSAFDFGNPRWKKIEENTKGIVFLATPHSGSDLSNLMQFVNRVLQGVMRASVSVEELEANHSRLRELNNVYRNHTRLSQIPVDAYFETQPYNPVGLVVDQASADPGMQGVVPIGVGADHITICKIAPEDKTNSIVYNSIKLFIEDYLLAKTEVPQRP
ncbi:MAG: hypothetical protein AAF215_01290 [Cyanobacteria bacterium P01_A01_bin.123]